MKRYFCTYFDQNFIYQGLALYQSLRQHAGDFTLWILCFDEVVYELLGRLDLPNLQRIRLTDFEAAYPELAAVKSGRSMIEYYWTSTPFLPLYILTTQPQVDRIVYLDADLFFYSDLGPIDQEWSDGLIYIIPHRFDTPSQVESELTAGIYNVGFVGFRRDSSSVACLERWVQQTLSWCYNRMELGLLGDQKYLDDWPERFTGVVVSQHHGIGAGGWNIANYQLTHRQEQIYLNDSLLVILHLNFVEMLSSHFFMAIPRWSLRPVYRPYAAALRQAICQVKRVAPEFQPQYAHVSPWILMERFMRGGIVFICQPSGHRIKDNKATFKTS